VFDVHPTRARWARSRLRARGRLRIQCIFGERFLDQAPTETGPCTVRLWRPHTLLAEALDLARGRWGDVSHRTLDLACGTGRDAVFMALSGLAVSACDVLPDALARASDLARRNGVALSTSIRDLEADPALPDSAYDLISCFHFLCRPLMPHIARAVKRGGLVVYETFLRAQRERFGKPRSDAHLLLPGELRSLFAGWQILIDREGLADPRRMVASLVALKPA
jgi:SAM-dependent methyltransferase